MSLAPLRGPPRPLPDWGKIHRKLRRKAVTLTLLWLEYKAVQPGRSVVLAGRSMPGASGRPSQVACGLSVHFRSCVAMLMARILTQLRSIVETECPFCRVWCFDVARPVLLGEGLCFRDLSLRHVFGDPFLGFARVRLAPRDRDVEPGVRGYVVPGHALAGG